MKLSLVEMIDYIKTLREPEGVEDFFTSLIDGSIHVNVLPDYLSFITNISDHTFSYCSNLALTSLPEGIVSIGHSAFEGCTALTTLTFKGTPTSIDSTAFNGCTNLTTINVPWSEDEVANAPWGATNATINYNYTE